MSTGDAVTRFAPVVAGAALAWLALSYCGPTPEVVDDTAPLVETIDSIAALNATLAAERARERAAYADSLQSWETRRRGLERTASSARTYADSIAAVLSGDPAIAEQVQELRAAHFVEVEAVAAQRDTWMAEALTLRTQTHADSVLIASLSAEIVAWETLDAERVRVNGALQHAIRKQHKEKRLLAAVGVAAVAWGLTR
jgi:hypothetical protein